MVGRIVAIGVALGVVAEIGDVTVAVVAVVVDNIPAGAGRAYGSYLIGRLAGCAGLVGVAFRQYGAAAVLCYLLGYSSSCRRFIERFSVLYREPSSVFLTIYLRKGG